MKSKKSKKSNLDNFFNEMSYELAGDIGAVDNEEMLNNKKLISGRDTNTRKNTKKN